MDYINELFDFNSVNACIYDYCKSCNKWYIPEEHDTYCIACEKYYPTCTMTKLYVRDRSVLSCSDAACRAGIAWHLQHNPNFPDEPEFDLYGQGLSILLRQEAKAKAEAYGLTGDDMDKFVNEYIQKKPFGIIHEI